MLNQNRTNINIFMICISFWVLYMVSLKAPFISRNPASFLKSLFVSSLLCSVQTELVWESSSF
uniref:Uncharacterized gastric protein YC11P n=1 Tax=Homo sapiens TaxID=9606 RepID=Q9NYZ8_HUMAN|nr:uncharacterized gastric protein YC11P [Homo sapiens]